MVNLRPAVCVDETGRGARVQPDDGEMSVDGDDLRGRIGNVSYRVSRIGGRGGSSLPDITARAWRRAARLVDAFGVEEALTVLDARAERALMAGRIGTACGWRDLMAAIHSMSEEERSDGDVEH